MSLRYYFAMLFSTFSLFAMAQAHVSKPSVKVGGEVTKPMILSLEDLQRMKQVKVTAKDKSGKDHEYKGINIAEILSTAGATMDKQLRGKNLGKYLLVKCADGYEIVLSLAEVDSSFTDRVTILAYESDGKPLAAGVGPFRLIVPGEKKPARSAMQVVALTVNAAKE
jgi:DMSO/TMAO reductase YedYZ molybdopterin-dependent catalytic subunit